MSKTVKNWAAILSILFLVLSKLSLPGVVHASIFDQVKSALTNFISPEPSPTPSPSQTVLGNSGYNTESPRIFINGGDNTYSSGGLIMQASTDDPAIFIGGYQYPKNLEIKLYKAGRDDVTNYLVHDKDYAQKNRNLDTSAMTFIATVNVEMSSVQEYGSKRQSLPIDGKGIWYLEISGDKVKSNAIVLRSDHGIVTAEGDNELIYWAQNFSSLRSMGEGGTLKTYSLLESSNELSSTSFDGSGLARTPISEKIDIAVSEFGDDIAIIPINLTYLNTGYGYGEFKTPIVKSRYFTFTDRPLYLPGDTVHFKSIIRDDDDSVYSVPSGTVNVTLTTDGNKKVKEMTLPISSDGTVSGDIKLDSEAKTGYYSLAIQTPKDQKATNYYEYTGVSDYSSTSFNVEFYRKPEATIDIESSFTDVIAGDNVSVDVVGSYFSGQPLSGQAIKYHITSADYYEYNFLSDYDLASSKISDDYRYGYWYGSQDIGTGSITLDKTGRAKLEVPTDLSFNVKGKSQVFTIEATLEDGSQDPAFTRKNILVRAGKFGIFATEYKWGTKINTEISLPIKLVPYHSQDKVGSSNIQAAITRHYWTKITDPNEKYPRFEEGEEKLEDISFSTDSSGIGNFSYTPKSTGSYTVVLSTKDSAGNNVTKEFNFYVSDQDFPIYTPGTSDESLSITSDKKKYYPGDKATFTISSQVEGRDVFFALERGHVRKYQIVKMNGKSSSIDITLTGTDQPNIYADVSSFSSYRLDKAQLGIALDTSNKKMVIELTPDKETYYPGDTVSLNVSTTNGKGDAMAAEVAVWAVDKALFELTDSRLGNIFETYWSERGNSTSYTHSLRGILVQTAERGGGGGGGDRTAFKDVAYWNPTVRTGSDGRSTISFKLPDNLTTWAIAAVGSTPSTVVGQSTAEIKTSKDLVVKPILPNIIRTKDELTVSAIVRNFTASSDTYNLQLEITGAEVEDPLTSTVKIDSLSTEQIYWRIKPGQGADEIKLKIAATSTTNTKAHDSVISVIKVVPFGFHEKTGQFQVGPATFDLNFAPDAQNDKSYVTLSLAPTLVTSLQSAMTYLLGYPYGCVEQITSRLVPALLAKRNESLFGAAMQGKNVDEYITAGLTKIMDAHSDYDGWAWWSHGNPSSFVTSYVLESLVDAKALGYEEETVGGIAAASNYLAHRFDNLENLNDEDRAMRRYGLSLVNQADQIPRPNSLTYMADDVLAMAVIGNYNAGDHNPDSNGLSVLMGRAQKEGDQAFWRAGSRENLGSIGASTAWAIRAIIIAEGDRNLATQGVQYLIRHRTSDYWYNSYATALTAKAILSLYGDGGESTPNLSYKVLLDNQLIGQGKIDSALATIKDVSIIPSTIKEKGSKLTIETSGTGQLYATLLTNEFRTDSNLKAEGHGLDIAREYVNDRDPNYSIGLGDVVQVRLTVSGLKQEESYLVIEDQLPSGLVPINDSFKNEQFNLSSNYPDWSSKEYTQNGAILSAYTVNPGTNVYSYKARVVSMGTFDAPPAVASLMYSPEIHGRTSVDTLKIGSESKLLPGKIAQSVVNKYGKWQYIVIAVLTILAIALPIYFYKKKHKLPKVEEPPISPDTHAT